ncbi:MAG: argininosuccinate synthase [Planctomycetes bacterium]|nr:argininosuccinate synthase [Planctomycetota bacterium]
MSKVEEIISRVKSTPVAKPRKVASAFSGGLDSCLGIELLRRVYGAQEIIAVTVDIGQGDDELAMARENALKMGIEPVLIDVRNEFSNDWVTTAIKANSDYEGYPVSTSMTRQLVAKVVAEKARELGCDAIIEGSSGKGNDQYRMHNVFTLFAPGLEVLVPARDLDLTRGDETELCKHWKVPIVETITGGDDKTLWCRSLASGAVDLDQELPDNIWMWLTVPEKAADKPTIVEIEFVEGVPVRMDGNEMPLADLVEKLNYTAGAAGIGRIDMFEDGIMDLKSREIYEAPAAKVILFLHRDLEQYTLMKDQMFFKRGVDAQWAYMMYHGQAFLPLRYDLEAFINESQKNVTGTYKVKLYKGSMEIMSRRSPRGLFFPEIRSIKTVGFDQRKCKDAAFVRGLPFMTLAMREEKSGGNG